MSAKTKIHIKASCGCGFTITGPTKDVVSSIKDHSESTGHGCEIHGTVTTSTPRPVFNQPRYSKPMELQR